MTITRIGDNSLMSDATVHNGVAYLSGQVAINAPDASFEEQARIIFKRIDDLLGQVGPIARSY